jgi:hypothetical protein
MMSLSCVLARKGGGVRSKTNRMPAILVVMPCEPSARHGRLSRWMARSFSLCCRPGEGDNDTSTCCTELHYRTAVQPRRSCAHFRLCSVSLLLAPPMRLAVCRARPLLCLGTRLPSRRNILPSPPHLIFPRRVAIKSFSRVSYFSAAMAFTAPSANLAKSLLSTPSSRQTLRSPVRPLSCARCLSLSVFH